MSQRRRRFRRGATLGRVNPSWRWEVGAPLVLIGVTIAAVGASVLGGGLLFWVGAGLVALGAVAFQAGR